MVVSIGRMDVPQSCHPWTISLPLVDQLNDAFSVKESPISQCNELESAVGGALQLSQLTGVIQGSFFWSEGLGRGNSYISSRRSSAFHCSNIKEKCGFLLGVMSCTLLERF